MPGTDRTTLEVSIDDQLTLRGERVGAGPALVLLHGGPGCADYFGGTSFESWLAEHFSVVTYDQRGAGRSPCEGPFSIQHNVTDLEALRRAINVDRVTLFGHSSGCVLATHYAAAHADRIERLILLSPAGIRPGWRAHFDAALRERFTDEQAVTIEQIDRAIASEPDNARRAALYRERFNAALPAYVDPAYRDAAPTLRDFNRDANIRVNNSLAALGRSRDWERSLAGFDRPVTILHGRSDPIPWSVVDDYCELFPQADAMPLHGVGHFPWLENETLLRTTLDRMLFAG
ncbi:MAG: alpha/beta hydrolase [Phycisphaerales bacterium]|nr:alpha/beta hydrolase [Phycisphaerales bacterium]